MKKINHTQELVGGKWNYASLGPKAGISKWRKRNFIFGKIGK